MLKLITLIGSGYEKYTSYLARQRTLQVLSQLSDATLRDIGVSRQLLNGGVTSWPWQSTDALSRQCNQEKSKQNSLVSIVQNTTRNPEQDRVATSPSIVSRSRSTYHRVMSKARAIRELRGYSDRELRDLSITRDCIVDAVNYGRPGIEQAFDSTSPATIHKSVAKPQGKLSKLNEGMLVGDKKAA